MKKQLHELGTYELLYLCRERGVTVTDSMSKKHVIDMLVANENKQQVESERRAAYVASFDPCGILF